MALDAYSLCPGGTGKKIKFCCGDFLPELQKIERMIEGEQFLACLQHVERLLAADPGHERACLLATRCELLRLTHQPAALQEAAAHFAAKHPENQVALAESAMAAVESDPRAALGDLQRAFRVGQGELSGRVYMAMGVVAAGLLDGGFPLAGRELLQLQCDIMDKDEQPVELLAAFSRAADIPLLLREGITVSPCPETAAWKDRYLATTESLEIGDWQTAADRLAGLATEVPDAPLLWRNLAAIRSWLADDSGCRDALRNYARLRAKEEGGFEDAVEAEATAMLLAKDPLGDWLEMFQLTWTVTDVERLQEALPSSSWQPIPFDPSRFGDGENPPPKNAYLLLERAAVATEGQDESTPPRLLGQALLFGRQTDCEARLEVTGVAADELALVKQMVCDAAGNAVESSPQEEVIGHWSASQKLMRTGWQPSRDTSPTEFRSKLQEYVRQAILERWPNLPLGVLDGRSPRDAAGDATLRLRLSAAILVLESWTERLVGGIDMNQLRENLGLPTLGPIVVGEQAVMEMPAVRLDRIAVDGLSDENLILVYHRAQVYGRRKAMRRFAQEIVERPSLADSPEHFGALAVLAQTEETLDKAIEHVDRGRRAAEAKGRSGASWDLMELSFCFAHRDGPRAMRLIEHIHHHHIEERGVGEALTRMLIDVGFLRPDGTPAFGPKGDSAAMAVDEPSTEQGELWTPESAQSGGGKLWTPD